MLSEQWCRKHCSGLAFPAPGGSISEGNESSLPHCRASWIITHIRVLFQYTSFRVQIGLNLPYRHPSQLLLTYGMVPCWREMKRVPRAALNTSTFVNCTYADHFCSNEFTGLSSHSPAVLTLKLLLAFVTHRVALPYARRHS